MGEACTSTLSTDVLRGRKYEEVRRLRRIFTLIALLSLSLPVFAAPGDMFFFEDFSRTKAGDLPSGWLGGENSMVKDDRRRKVLVLFQGKSDSIVISDMPLPENWQFDFAIHLGWQFDVSIGNVKVRLESYNGTVHLNDSVGEYGSSLEDKSVTLSVRKEGPVYKALVNGREVVMSRAAGAQTGNSLSFTFQQARQAGTPQWGGGIMTIYTMKGTEI